MNEGKIILTENFIRIDTDDNVAQQIVLKRRTNDVIDLNDRTNVLIINDVSEAQELINLLNDGISYLKTGR